MATNTHHPYALIVLEIGSKSDATVRFSKRVRTAREMTAAGNQAKGICKALQGFSFDDDKHYVRVRIGYHHPLEPGVEVGHDTGDTIQRDHSHESTVMLADSRSDVARKLDSTFATEGVYFGEFLNRVLAELRTAAAASLG